ncbi:MAG: Flp family type IVb pilin [Hyphomicrobiales bacterium]|nr:Flp family type IVb pilin [Hyphomicrobiales bacterium]
MRKIAQRFIDDETGTTAVEYGIIAAGIMLAIIATVETLGQSIVDLFTVLNDALAALIAAL